MKQTMDLNEMTVEELHQEAQKRNVHVTSHMRKAELIEELQSANSPAKKVVQAVESVGKALNKNEKQDAVSILIEDHKRVKKMFAQALEKETGDASIQQIAEQIVNELTVHTEVEEKLFYPALKAKALNDKDEEARDGVIEAYVEHGSVKDLIQKLESTKPTDESYKALVQVMSEQVEHHVEEEESEMFKQAKKLLGSVELDELGQQILQLKQKLSAKK